VSWPESSRRQWLGGVLALLMARPTQAAASLVWGFDQDWSLVRNQTDLDQLIALWRPLGAPLITFTGAGSVDSLLVFLKQTKTTVLLTGGDLVSLTRQILSVGIVPYVLAGTATVGLEELLPRNHVGIAYPTAGQPRVYPTQGLALTTETPVAQRREIVLTLQPLLTVPCWLLGVDLGPDSATRRTLHMYALTWLLRQPQVGLVLAGTFAGAGGLLDATWQPTALYEWWRTEREQPLNGGKII